MLEECQRALQVLVGPVASAEIPRCASADDRRRCRGRRIPGRFKSRFCLVQHRQGRRVVGLAEDETERKQDTRPLRVVVRRELERGREVADGCGERVEAGSPLAGVTEGLASLAPQPVVGLPRRRGELQGGAKVMSHHLRPIGGSVGREGLDPCGGRAMLRGAVRARNLPVGDVADERVRERVLLLSRHRAAPLAPDELLPEQRAEELLARI